MAKSKAKVAKKKVSRPALVSKKKITSKRASPSKQKLTPKSTPKKPAKKVTAKPVKAVTVRTKTAKSSAKAVPKTAKAPSPKVPPVKKMPTKTPAQLPIAIKAKIETTPKKAPVKTPAPVAVLAPPPIPEKKLKPEATKKPAVKTPAKPTPGALRKVINLDEVTLASGYRPSPSEEYMSAQHLAYFKQKLQNWRQELILESQETLEHLRTETRDVGDEAERASRESDNILELRTRDRYRKLLNKIDQALKRIEEGNYGYCEETGEEIGLGRLEARPIATLTVDAQERRELFQRQFRDDH